jgi:hypothetical protein
LSCPWYIHIIVCLNSSQNHQNYLRWAGTVAQVVEPLT